MTAGNGSSKQMDEPATSRRQGGRNSRRRENDEFQEVPEAGSLLACLAAQDEKDNQAVLQQQQNVVSQQDLQGSETARRVVVQQDARPTIATVDELELRAWEIVYRAVDSYPAAVAFIQQCESNPKLAKAHPALLVQAGLVVHAEEAERARIDRVQQLKQSRREAALAMLARPFGLLRAVRLWVVQRLRREPLREIGVRMDPVFADDMRPAAVQSEVIASPEQTHMARPVDEDANCGATPTSECSDTGMGSGMMAEQLEFELLMAKRPHGKKARTLRRAQEQLSRAQRAAG